MPNTREKLIEILRVPIYPHLDADPAEVVADYLLDNGVTFATDNNVGSKWISVKERLPVQEGWYLVFTVPDRGYKSINKGYFCKGYAWDNFTPRWSGAGGRWTNVTHWMPLPEPPKGA